MCAPVVCVFVCLLDALATQEVHKCCRVFNRFNAPLMNISNCHFATASGFWLWTQTRGFGFGFGFACFALAICGQFAGNRRQPVNWKVSCNYKTFFIILWHFCCCCLVLLLLLLLLLQLLIFCLSMHTILAKLQVASKCFCHR